MVNEPLNNLRYAAVIVETRKVDGFGNIVRQHLQYLPSHWQLIVYCADDNQHFIEAELQGLTYQLNTGITIANTNDYNKLFLNTDFWQPLTIYHRVLIFQADSELLRTGIEQFLQWDYVGAPWPFNQRGGNGGLSLRNPQAMVDCIQQHYHRTPSLGLLLLLTRMMIRKRLLKRKATTA